VCGRKGLAEWSGYEGVVVHRQVQVDRHTKGKKGIDYVINNTIYVLQIIMSIRRLGDKYSVLRRTKVRIVRTIAASGDAQGQPAKQVPRSYVSVAGELS